MTFTHCILRIAKTVSFGAPPPYSATPNGVTPFKPMLQEVKDLCVSIQQLHKSSQCIGFSLDSKSKLLRGVYPVDTPIERPTSCQLITLEELLTKPPLVNGRPAKLSKKERYYLSITLASSALQLNSTPWLSDQWTAKDIYFHQTAVGPRPVDVDHPYVTSTPLETVGDSITQRKPRGFHNKNTILLALAVALLELYFGESAEKHQELEQTSNGTHNSNPWQLCAIAYDWAESEQENMSAAFSNAVNHCLRCFSDPSASLQDSEFLQAAVESIVLPLQDELSQFLGKTTT